MSTTTTEAARITKRKLDDAISILDSAVNESKTDVVDHGPSPSKRPATGRSIYASLSKYGFLGKDKDPEKQSSSRTPRLSSLLSRSRLHKLERSSSHPGSAHPQISLPQALASRPPYRPTSTQDFLIRLSTFKLSTYRDKPRIIDAVAAAKCGWKNDGQDRLACDNCNSAWVVGSISGMSPDAAKTLVERQKAAMITGHKESCPWRKRQCDDLIYRISLQGSTKMAHEIRDRARVLSPLVENITIKYPLSTTQLTSLLTTINSLPPAQDTQNIPSEQEPPALSQTALILSLFGWGLTSPSSFHPLGHRQASITLSVSRATSASLSRAPSLARASNNPRFTMERPPTPASTGTPAPMSRLSGRKSDVTLSCSLCQRKIGLWSFQAVVDEPAVNVPPSTSRHVNGTKDVYERSAGSPPPVIPTAPYPSYLHPRRPMPSRVLDVTTEHRSFCPYIVKSTPMPSYPAFAGGSTGADGNPPPKRRRNEAETLVEGWRAVLSVVNRAGMGARRRKDDIFGPVMGTDGQVEDEGAASVDSMVESVKKGGPRDLIRYVKGLLG